MLPVSPPFLRCRDAYACYAAICRDMMRHAATRGGMAAYRYRQQCSELGQCRPVVRTIRHRWQQHVVAGRPPPPRCAVTFELPLLDTLI